MNVIPSLMIDPHCRRRAALTIIVQHFLPNNKMTWKNEVAYSMTPVKLLTVPIGGWPLQEYNKFALGRHIVCSFGLVRFQILYRL